MGLPHFNITDFSDTTYQNIFEVILITPTLILKENLYYKNINFISEKNSDSSFIISIIEMTFTFNQDSIKDWNTKDYLNDIGYVLLTLHDSIGYIITKDLIEVEFVSSKVNFNYNIDDVLCIQLRLKNLGIEKDFFDSVDHIQKRLNRSSKLNYLI